MPEYFDSQASAAASLGIDIDKIREAKRAGCKAFRSGRVYQTALLEWFEEKRAARLARNPAGPNGAEDNAKVRLRWFCEAIICLMRARDAGGLSDEQFFELTDPIVKAARDKELQQIFVGKLYDWLHSQFTDIRDARRWVQARQKAERASDFWKAKARKYLDRRR